MALWGNAPSQLTNIFLQAQQAEQERQRQARSIQQMFQALGLPLPQGAMQMNPYDARMVAEGTLNTRNMQQRRQNELADIADERQYKKSMIQDERNYEEGLREDDRNYKRSIEADERAYNSGEWDRRFNAEQEAIKLREQRQQELNKEPAPYVATDYDAQILDEELNDIYSSYADFPEERIEALWEWYESPEIKMKLEALEKTQPEKSAKLRTMFENALRYSRKSARQLRIRELQMGVQ